MAKIKRSLFKTFLNTTPSIAATWVLISPGVTAAKIGYNPKTSEEIYIHEDTGTISIDSYAPNIPIEASVSNTEPAFEYLDAFRKTRATLSSAETEICNVWLYKGTAGADGIYLAEKQDVSIQIDKFGGAGGQNAKIAYTINYLGNPEAGLFNATDSTFTANDTSALLASLVFSSDTLILSPVFASNRIWYTTETDDTTNVITGVAVDVGVPVITIDVDGVAVINGDPATWVAGLNTVVVTSTSGGDVATYVVLVTYTPGA
jgi:hypothetical protein